MPIIQGRPAEKLQLLIEDLFLLLKIYSLTEAKDPSRDLRTFKNGVRKNSTSIIKIKKVKSRNLFKNWKKRFPFFSIFFKRTFLQAYFSLSILFFKHTFLQA
ncbi:hypothetical protein EO92_15750 [Methanosarcina sp. 2.H.A.1B.4]|nr:hypothetical protein EO92_15750 [Methanosarcina sp. 2.H.A.1B.4]